MWSKKASKLKIKSEDKDERIKSKGELGIQGEDYEQ